MQVSSRLKKILDRDGYLRVKNILNFNKDLKPILSGDSDLKIAMKMISKTQVGPKEQTPSMGCNIKWFN